jgi:hypothetical protein
MDLGIEHLTSIWEYEQDIGHEYNWAGVSKFTTGLVIQWNFYRRHQYIVEMDYKAVERTFERFNLHLSDGYSWGKKKLATRGNASGLRSV